MPASIARTGTTSGESSAPSEECPTTVARGRVVFVKATGRYHVYTGPEMLTHAPLIRHVMDAMYLPSAQTEVRLALHVQTRSFLTHLPDARTEVQLALRFRIQQFP